MKREIPFLEKEVEDAFIYRVVEPITFREKDADKEEDVGPWRNEAYEAMVVGSGNGGWEVEGGVGGRAGAIGEIQFFEDVGRSSVTAGSNSIAIAAANGGLYSSLVTVGGVFFGARRGALGFGGCGGGRRFGCSLLLGI